MFHPQSAGHTVKIPTFRRILVTTVTMDKNGAKTFGEEKVIQVNPPKIRTARTPKRLSYYLKVKRIVERELGPV